MVKVKSCRNVESEKPDVVAEYNTCKAFINLLDQIKAYFSCFLKISRKIAVELLLESALVNAYILFRSVISQQTSITAFGEEVALSLLS